MQPVVAKLIVAPALLLAALSTAHAQDAAASDITGRWVGRTYSIIAGHGGHWPDGAGTFVKPMRAEIDLVIAVTGQEGRRFWGVTTTTSKNGRKIDEPFIGELTGANNGDVVMADTDGVLTGHITGDSMAFCYTQPALKGSAVVSCTEVKRSR